MHDGKTIENKNFKYQIILFSLDSVLYFQTATDNERTNKQQQIVKRKKLTINWLFRLCVGVCVCVCFEWKMPK